MGVFSSRLAAKAVAEEAAFSGVRETHSPLKERIGEYWTFLSRPDLDGGDNDVPWSAAFISFMHHIAGAGTLFPYSAQHSVYFYRTINDKLIKKPTPFWGYEPKDVTIAVGDVLGMNRESGPAIDYDWASHHADYKSHADIVVDVAATAEIHTIGGNVGDRVARKIFVKKNGKLVNKAAAKQQVFVVIRTSLP